MVFRRCRALARSLGGAVSTKGGIGAHWRYVENHMLHCAILEAILGHPMSSWTLPWVDPPLPDSGERGGRGKG
eukprot:2277065-Pyramimonas_sp.AAC.1